MDDIRRSASLIRRDILTSIFCSHNANILEISSPSVSADPRSKDRSWRQERTGKRDPHAPRNVMASNQKDGPLSRFLFLPEELMEKVLSYLLYDEISHLRVVCLKFNRCCMRLLNRGFIKVERYHSHCLRDVKAQLPRRESERRNHCLARHCDILTAIETRLSLLGMTFMKYVDMNLCCFIPGKVLDEIYRVLRYIQTTSTPPRAHEILQELRDISSMAMEHFDEKIAPALKQKIGSSTSTISVTPQGAYTVPVGTPTGYTTGSQPLIRTLSPRQEMTKLSMCIKQLTSANTALKKELLDYKIKMIDHKKKILEQDKCILEQNRIIAEHSSRIAEQEGKINEVNRKLLEYDRYFADIMTELSRSREESTAGRISELAAIPASLSRPSSHDKEGPEGKASGHRGYIVPSVRQPLKRTICSADQPKDSKLLKESKPIQATDNLCDQVTNSKQLRETNSQERLPTNVVSEEHKGSSSVTASRSAMKSSIVCHLSRAARLAAKRTTVPNVAGEAKLAKKKRVRQDVRECWKPV